MKHQFADTTIVRVIDEETFVYNRDRGLVHSFNTTGGFIVAGIRAGLDKSIIVEGLCAEYEVEASVASEQYDAFVNELQNVGALGGNK